MTLDASSLGERLKSLYGLPCLEVHWPIHRELGPLVWVSAGDRKFAARLYRLPEALDELEYHVALIGHLEGCGVCVEAVVPTTGGARCAVLDPGRGVALSVQSPGSAIPVDFGEDLARTWGSYVARMHNACESWRPVRTLRSAVLRAGTASATRSALAYAERPPDRALLRELAMRLRSCEPVLAAGGLRPVHGDLWPGNLLEDNGRLRAIDFRCAGDGWRVVDVATAFRWMPWRTAPLVARSRWAAWIESYTAACPLAPLELAAVPAVAGLCQVYWMNLEVANARTSGAGHAGYVRDHCDAIGALLQHGDELAG